MLNLDVTFSQQAELWLRDLASRKRKPVSPATLRVFASYVRRLTPVIDEMKLADINNGTLKLLVQRLDQENLSAKTINELVAVVKQVVASLVDQETGQPILKTEWSARFIDCPAITTQKQPCATREDVERCITNAKSDQEKLLYAVLAGSGLRIAEALAIHVNSSKVGTSWNPDIQAIVLRSSIFNGREIPRLKTTAAKRTVDLDPQLNDLIRKFVEMNRIQPGNYLFQARSGRSMHLKTARERLAKHAIPGFHSFRRFRVTRLRELGIPEDLLRYWVGHSGKGITDRYSKLAENTGLRKQWASKCGLGFALPEIGNACDPRPHTAQATTKPGIRKDPKAEIIVKHCLVHRKPAQNVPDVVEASTAPAYIANDEDLDPTFFEEPAPSPTQEELAAEVAGLAELRAILEAVK